MIWSTFPANYYYSSCLAIPEIFHDEPIVDRKSTFQAHVARVNDTSEVHAVMMYLLRNKKIAAATHNIQVRTTPTSETEIFAAP